MTKYPKRGKPVIHPPILDITTDKVYKTFSEAAEDCKVDRNSVRRVCLGIQKHAGGHVFIFMEDKLTF